MARGRRWTKEEDSALLDGAGVFSIAWFQKKGGVCDEYANAPLRSRRAVYGRIKRLIGSGSLTRGTYSLAKASQETGYTRQQIQRAQSALGQKWKRLSRRGPFLITFDQLEEIVTWLIKDYWCARLRLYGCVNCGEGRGVSRGRGLCRRCYGRIRRLHQIHGWPWPKQLLAATVQTALSGRYEYKGLCDQLTKNVRRGWSLTEKQLLTITRIRDERSQ